MRLQLKDNTLNQPVIQGVSIEDLQRIANTKIGDLDDVLVYPSSWEESKDRIKDKFLFSLENKNDVLSITTGNIMGFIGMGGTEIAITSRFAEDKGKDYFLHYMLQKTSGFNIVNLDTSKGINSILDFLLYLFPSYLARAMRQGLYKEYKWNHYNNANIKGTIDIPRHIRLNVPFQGKIAYTTREYSYDNPVLQLIRHTIEYIRSKPIGKGILSKDEDTIGNSNTILFHTQSYHKNSRQKVIIWNSRPVTHPYFTEYRPLQRLCLQILRHEKLSLGKNNEKIYGILFDGALLWENYIANVFKEHCSGIQHKTHTDNLFQDGQGIIPDFITYIDKPFTASFIGDTKYKFIDKRSNEAAREDYYQLLTYMYRYSCKTGFIIFPLNKNDEKYLGGRNRVLKTANNANSEKSMLIELGLKIPESAPTFDDFCNQMNGSEQHFIEVLRGK